MSTEVLRRLLVKAVISHLAVFLLILTVAMPAIAVMAANSVDSAAIVDGQVKTRDIRKLAVTTKKIALGAVRSAQIKDGSITNADIAAGAAISDSKISYSIKTGYYSIAGSGLVPPPTVAYNVAGSEMWLTGGPGLARASVHLPSGATVTKVRATAMDNGASGSMYVLLNRFNNNGGSGEIMGTTGLTGNSGSHQDIVDITINNATIDNNNYSYMVWAYFSAAGTGMTIHDIVIEYTYKAPGH